MQRFASAIRTTAARSLAARSATSSLSSVSAVSSQQHRRAFHNSLFSSSPAVTKPTSASAAAAAQADVPYAEDAIIHGESAGIMQKYGWYPLMGLGGAIAVSKELLILNAESVIVFTFGSFCFLSYVYGWESAGKALDKQCEDIRSEIVSGYDEKEKMLEDSIQQLTRFQGMSKSVQNATEDAITRNAAVAVYKTHKYKTDLYGDVDKALQELSNRQMQFDRDTQLTMAKSTADVAHNTWTSSSAAVKASYVDLCIANLYRPGQKAAKTKHDVNKDPVSGVIQTAIKTALPHGGLKEHYDVMWQRAEEMSQSIFAKYPGKESAEAADLAAYKAGVAAHNASAAEHEQFIKDSAANVEGMGDNTVTFDQNPSGWKADAASK